MPDFTRRNFLHTSLGLAAGMAATNVLAQDKPAKEDADAKEPEPSKTDAAAGKSKPTVRDDLINVAIIGCGGRGGSHLSDLLNLKDYVQIVGLVDADESHAAGPVKRVEEETGVAPKTYQDVRAMLEDKDVHAVTVATPNHWHTLAAILAIQAGKDVYVEKPCSHNVTEGRRLMEFARKYERLVQHGTQTRSNGTVRGAIKAMQAGAIGRITLARAMCYKRRKSIGDVAGPQPVPAGVDYNLWLGPAPEKPVMRSQFHYDWHWFWDYGNGDIGNQGVHQMDVAFWGLGKTELPKRVQSIGGRFGYIDDGETPNTQIALMDYDDVQVIFEVRGLETPQLMGAGVGNIFYGTEGTLVIDGGSPTFYDAAGKKMDVELDKSGGGDHFTNWVKALSTRRRDDLTAEIEVGHYSSAMCHLPNISYQLGTKQPFVAKRQAFGDDRLGAEAFARTQEHLAGNGLKLQEIDYIVGPMLELDPKTERFTNNDEANKLLTREYRAPFVVPEKVS